MKAAVGDRIVVASTTLDQPIRDGRVVEVRHGDGTPPYLVEWSDTGERTLVFPGPDAHIEHAGEVHREHRVVKTWTATIRITEEGDATTAVAVLGAESPTAVDGVGQAHRNPHDPASPLIGDEVAVARALRRLADRLLGVVESEIRVATGVPAHVDA